MHGDLRMSECTRFLPREIYCSEITRVRETFLRPFLSLFLDLSARRAFLDFFFTSFGYQLYQLLHGTQLRVSFLPFSFLSTVFFLLATLPENEELEINLRLIVTHTLQITSLHCICIVRLWIFATLLHYVGETHRDIRLSRYVTFFSILFLLFYFFIFLF